MGENSKIEWTDATWNPVVGCSVISPGCTNCYAMKMAGRLEAMGSPIYTGHTTKTKAGFVWNGKVSESNWGQVILPLSWKRPRRVFVNSMSDLFHKDMPTETIERVFAVMALTQRHTYQVLTKRPDRMRAEAERIGKSIDILERHAREMGWTLKFEGLGLVPWPLPNVWLGVSVEDQARADERRGPMQEIAAKGWTTYVSYEPAIGEVAWIGWDFPKWIIIGGESGPGARPFNLDWMRSTLRWCRCHDIAAFCKQLGARPRGNAMRALILKDRKGGNWDEWPTDLRVREFPAEHPGALQP